MQPTFSDGHDTGIFSWDYLYFLGSQQDELWQKYEERLAEAGADRDAPMIAARRRPAAITTESMAARCRRRRSRTSERSAMSETHSATRRVDEAAKSERVRGVFDSVAPKYDVMNDLMSLGLHRAWKAYAVAVANLRTGDKVLDIAGGTGDLARALRAAASARVVSSCTATSTRRCCGRAGTA